MTGNFTRRSLVAAALAAMLLSGPAQADLGPLGMQRYVSFVIRPAGMSHADFIKALMGQAMKAKTLSRPLGGLVVSEVQPPASNRPAQLDTDAMVELWTTDEADHDALLASADGKKWAEGMDALYGKNTTYVVREHLFTVPKRGGAVKSVSLLVRKDGFSVKDFVGHWTGIHGVMATKVPGLVGFVLSEVQRTEPPKGDPLMPENNGIAELWWDAPPGSPPGTSVRSDYANGWYKDGDTFIDRGKSRGLSVIGTVIIPVSE